MKKTLMALFLAVGFGFAACPVHAAPLKVVTSFSILGDLAQQVGGDDVRVTTLVGADGDAHVFQPTPNDAKALKEADVIIVNGLGFEGWMGRLIQSSGSKAPIITASQGISKKLNMKEEGHKGHHHGSTDPHAWQSLANGRQYVKNIAAGLAKADATNAHDYAARAAALDADLAALDAWVKQQIASVPTEKRRVITTHDAFGYFADAYQVTFLAPTGFSTDDEPSAKEMKHLIQQINSGKTRALFFENMSNPNVIKQLATETGAVVGPALYADALSAPDGNAATYQAMFKYNVTELVKAMGRN
ncbi:MAG: metal ABC transporter solute-binding protein, Zn/Mn family [Holosporales bacterium]|jgi:zinc/manganese transport system substrate-binding protein